MHKFFTFPSLISVATSSRVGRPLIFGKGLLELDIACGSGKKKQMLLARDTKSSDSDAGGCLWLYEDVQMA